MPEEQDSKSELELQATNLVLQILERGRLQVKEQEGEIGVRDSGINIAKKLYIDKIISLARNEAISLTDTVIGKDIEVTIEQSEDWSDDSVFPNPEEQAIKTFQATQRLKLAEYQNSPQKPVRTAENGSDERTHRVDRTKPAVELEGYPGTDELSLNEE